MQKAVLLQQFRADVHLQYGRAVPERADTGLHQTAEGLRFERLPREFQIEFCHGTPVYQRTGSSRTPWMRSPGIHSYAPRSVSRARSGQRSSSVRTAIRPSILASGAPRQKWMP